MTPADAAVLAIPVLLLVVMALAQRRRQRSFAAQQARLQPGMSVITTSGLYAELVELDERVAVLETAPGQTTRWDRRAVLAQSVPTGGDQAPTDEK